MTEVDVQWFKRCHAAGLVKGRMLEVGAARIEGAANLCDIAKELGVEDTTGADIDPYDGVDVVVDFGLQREDFQKQWRFEKFSTVCIFNVLEHTFDPLTVLTNTLSCVESGGMMLVVTPAVWPIHNYPGDYNRLLPDWYRAFSKRHQLTLLDQQFCWLSQFGIEAINSTSEVALPTYLNRSRGVSKTRYWTSRIGHKLLNTYGRSHWATHSAIGAAFLCK
jgi:SAM-dependent methyltransferase